MTSFTGMDGSELMAVKKDGTEYLVSVRQILQTVRAQDINVWDQTSITLRVKDAFTYIKTTSGSAVTINVLANSAHPFGASTIIAIEQGGAGQITFVAGAGVTINSPETRKTAKQYAIASLFYLGNDVWTLGGYLELSA